MDRRQPPTCRPDSTRSSLSILPARRLSSALYPQTIRSRPPLLLACVAAVTPCCEKRSKKKNLQIFFLSTYVFKKSKKLRPRRQRGTLPARACEKKSKKKICKFFFWAHTCSKNPKNYARAGRGVLCLHGHQTIFRASQLQGAQPWGFFPYAQLFFPLRCAVEKKLHAFGTRHSFFPIFLQKKKGEKKGYEAVHWPR